MIIDLKYERLSTFCYACGTIGHIERDCNVTIEEAKIGRWKKKLGGVASGLATEREAKAA